ncbi:Uncharacterised protein [Pseudomonas aeruginosa]|nr:Uncharacterised protein [Pseudomonas aeruginosa]
MRRTEPAGEGQGLTDPAEQQQALHRRSSQAWPTRLPWRSMAEDFQRHLGGHDAAGEAQGVGADRIAQGHAFGVCLGQRLLAGVGGAHAVL